MRFMAFGKNLRGELLFKPASESAIFEALRGALDGNISALRRTAAGRPADEGFRGEMERRVRDAGDPRSAGWTYLVAKDDPQRTQIIEIVKPLAADRGMQDPASPLAFEGPAQDDWIEWLQDRYFGIELAAGQVPRYVLMIGGPDRIPFAFQSLFDTAANVGRLCFDSLDGLQAYVDKVRRLEASPDPVVKREAIFFGTDEGSNDPTYFSREYMVKPLAQYVRDSAGYAVTEITGADATKAKLAQALAGGAPALVYTASHGLGLTGQPLDDQKRYNGAICCQANGEFGYDDLFSAADVPATPFLEGSVFFQFACYGYGTPAVSDYTHWLAGHPERYAAADFMAALPQRLLAHPHGPIAYIGHLDTAFMHGFTDQNEPHIPDRWHARIQPFLHAIAQLLGVQPSGLAMEDMGRRYALSSAQIASTYDRDRRGSLQWTDEVKARFVDAWIYRNDAQNYMVFGDPAARLRIPEG